MNNAFFGDAVFVQELTAGLEACVNARSKETGWCTNNGTEAVGRAETNVLQEGEMFLQIVRGDRTENQ